MKPPYERIVILHHTYKNLFTYEHIHECRLPIWTQGAGHSNPPISKHKDMAMYNAF